MRTLRARWDGRLLKGIVMGTDIKTDEPPSLNVDALENYLSMRISHYLMEIEIEHSRGNHSRVDNLREMLSELQFLLSWMKTTGCTRLPPEGTY